MRFVYIPPKNLAPRRSKSLSDLFFPQSVSPAISMRFTIVRTARWFGMTLALERIRCGVGKRPRRSRSCLTIFRQFDRFSTEGPRVRQRVIATLGRLDQFQASGALDGLPRSLRPGSAFRFRPRTSGFGPGPAATVRAGLGPAGFASDFILVAAPLLQVFRVLRGLKKCITITR